MTTALILGVIVLVGAIVAWVTWHRGADERLSVQHHQHTLETLRHVADRRPPSSWPSAVRRGGSATARLRKPAKPRREPAALASPQDASYVIGSSPPARERASRSSSGKNPAKDEAKQRRTMVGDASLHAPSEPSTSLPPSRRADGPNPSAAARARHDARLRVRRTRLAAGTTLIVVALAVGGVLVFGSSGTTPRTSHGPHAATAAGRGHPTIPAPSTSHAPASPTPYSATYGAPSSNYTIVISASAPCWVLVTQVSTKKVVWTGTVPAGGSQPVPASGDVVVELGAPSDATVSLDGRALQLPTGYRAPFDLTFQAA